MLPLIAFEEDIWNWVKTRRWLRILCNYGSPIVKEGRFYQLHDGDAAPIYMRGLTTLMKDALYADRAGEMTPAERHVAALQRQAASRTHMQSVPLRGLHKRLSGFMLGLYIHRQIENYVHLTEAQFKLEYPEGMHPWATLLLAAMLERRWRPVKAEYKVRAPAPTHAIAPCSPLGP